MHVYRQNENVLVATGFWMKVPYSFQIFDRGECLFVKYSGILVFTFANLM